MEYAYLISGEIVVKKDCNVPIAKKTPLGWCCMGPMSLYKRTQKTVAMRLQLAFLGYNEENSVKLPQNDEVCVRC